MVGAIVSNVSGEPTDVLPEQTQGRRPGWWEWLTRREALRAARSRRLEASPAERELMRRAQSAARLADRVFDAVEPVWIGAGKALAADLYRQSVYWSLAAHAPADARRESPEALWAVTAAPERLALPWEPTERSEVENAATRGDFQTFAELSEETRQRVAGNLRTLAHSALELGDPADRSIRKLLFQRFVRVIGLSIVVAVIGVAAVIGLQYLTRKPDLLAGRPWRASSTWAECKPEIRTCGGLRSKIFFHTKEETEPWVEFDLINPTAFSEVYIKNRTESVPDRAIPLVIEVSNDAQAWRTVARKDDSFMTWTASFPVVTARYIRLRVTRRSSLHLERVEVHS